MQKDECKLNRLNLILIITLLIPLKWQMVTMTCKFVELSRSISDL